MNKTKVLFNCFTMIILFSVLTFAQDKDMMNNDKMMKKDTMMKNNNIMQKSMKMKDEKMMHSMIKIFKNDDGVAINGADPVAYFTQNKPVMGSSIYGYKWSGAEWHFASEKDLEMFKKDPDKYAPQYGGYCAYAVSKNKLASSDSKAWTVKDRKLYLNNNLEVRELFKKNINQNIKLANERWPKLNMPADKMMDNKMDNN
jgi:YHS domain-containing protein